jgi:arsenate reductase-like glutaredoxin family protein
VSAPVIQVIGTHDSADTRKAERWFKERSVPIAFVDLKERPLSRGELESIARAVGAEQLLDRESKAFERAGLAFQVFDPFEKALADPLLLKMPIVRRGREAVAGFRPDAWQPWLKPAGA